MKATSTLLLVLFLFSSRAFVLAQSESSVLFLVNDASVYNNADQLIAEELSAIGLDVRKVTATETTPDDAQGVDLIIISSTILAGTIDVAFASSSIPILTWEGGMYDDLMLCSAPSWGISIMNNDSARIVNAEHPLAAGFDNNVRIVREKPQEYTIVKTDSLPPGATVIATMTDDIGDEQAIIFAFEKGAELVDGSHAPARRVGFFMRDNTATLLTNEGWDLFRAAVSWAMDDSDTGVLQQNDAPSNTRLLSNYPNPFNPQTSIPFVVASSSRVAIDIFDVRGNLVVSLLHGVVSAGRHSVQWDGRNLLGRSAPSGIYFVRLQSNDFTQTRKILLTR